MVNVMKKRTVIILSVIALVIVTILNNPLFRSQRRMRNEILRLTPIGTSMDDVLTVIESQEGWEIHKISYDRGYRYPRGYEPIPEGQTIIGDKYIEVFYTLPFNTYVTVFWGFDEDEILIDVYTYKEFDCL